MKWLNQFLQAVVFFGLVISFLAYVEATTDRPEEQSQKVEWVAPACWENPAAVEAEALRPNPHHPEMRDPNHLLIAARP